MPFQLSSLGQACYENKHFKKACLEASSNTFPFTMVIYCLLVHVSTHPTLLGAGAVMSSVKLTLPSATIILDF